MEAALVYLPMDRRQALHQGIALADRSHGSALFVDIAGFTPLTEALREALGPRRGAEVLTHHLNLVYDTLIAEVDRYGGSVVGFAGDGITCWFEGDSGLRATASALAMQQGLGQLPAIQVPGGSTISLAMKAAITHGPIRRFIAGDPQIQLLDVLAGGTLERMASVEQQARTGEVLLDGHTASLLANHLQVSAWRGEGEPEERVAIVEATHEPIPPTPWPPIPTETLSPAQIRPWLLPLVYERLAAGHGEFLTELRPAVALFLRFVGIDYDGDAEAGSKLDSYLRWVQATATRYGGTLLDLTIGDKGNYLYVVFGAPTAHEDDTLRAVLTAWALRSPPAELTFIQDVQIGISRGTMRTGAYGGRTRRTYGALGDEVNLAARLMQHARPGEILVSGRIQYATLARAAWEVLTPVQIKGKREPIPLFRLMGFKALASAGVAEPSYVLPMVGREAELALIEEKLALALGGQGQIIGLTAEAGMGKSRLVAEAVRLIQTRGLSIYGGAGQSYGTNTPYLPWQPIWRAFFDLEEEEEADAPARLHQSLAQLDSSLLPRLPLLGRVLNLSLPENDLTRSLDAESSKRMREALLADCLQARTSGIEGALPLVLVLEDCHWLDPLSQDLLELIGRSLVSLPVFLLLAYRPRVLEQDPLAKVMALPHASEISLAEFTIQETRQLIQHKLEQHLGPQGTNLFPDDLLEQVTRRAQGNPFYIEELINFLYDQGLDPRDSAAWQQQELPSSLHRLVLSRIDQLGEQQKITLKVASVIGRLFRVAWLHGYYPALGEIERIKNDLERLSRLELTPLEQPEPELTYLFKHLVTQEVAYESLAYETRAALHEQLARFLEEQEGTENDAYLDLLAYHYERSTNRQKKREYLRRAGAAAKAAFANETAIHHYERLLALLEPEEREEQIAVILQLSEVQVIVGKWEDALSHYRQGLTLADSVDPHSLARCQAALGHLLNKRGDHKEALGWLGQAQATFEHLGAKTEAGQIRIDMGRMLWRQGEYEQARTLLEQSLAQARLNKEKRNIASAAGYLGNLAGDQGDFEQARRYYEESLSLRTELGDRVGANVVRGNLAVLALDQGEFEQAQQWLEESLAQARELGEKRGMGTFLNNLGAVAYLQRDPDRAQSLWEESLALRRAIGDRSGIAAILKNLGLAAHEQGRLTDAWAYYEEGLALSRELGDSLVIGSILMGQGHVALAWEQAAHARMLYREGLAVACALGDKRRMIGGLIGLAGVIRGDEAEVWQRALRLLAAAQSQAAAIRLVMEPVVQELLERTMAAARARLDAATFAIAWQEGQDLTLEQAAAHALEEESL